ncbi:MAG: ATP-binding cassette domain-containing protein [Chitinophagaceae bacterium]|nr:ATP-binding cassette domain-containing protein [Chitinophagaceae bacterium]
MIKVEGLGKKYIISHEGVRGYTALRDVISNKAKGLVKRNLNLPAREEFWALKDVSFEIQKGEAVGIIGRNGAGKSTLLKILSRITEPTTGRIELNGRVASLLEVGTGFHPELTGRENIFLNGAILGMSRVDIRKKFDEIVDFSGVEKFLDTPVKRFSSGMYVRLAFAVAAHLEPEILVVDEVLAVGDAEFQRKCLGKMNDVSKNEGRTVIFVSHDLSAITSLTQKCIFLENGQIRTHDSTNKVISVYTTSQNRNNFYIGQPSSEIPQVTSVEIVTSAGGTLQANGGPFTVMFEITIPHNNFLNIALSFQIFNHLNQPIVYNWIFDIEEPICRKKGINRLRFEFPIIRLYKGNYFLKVHLAETKTKIKFQEFDCCSFEIEMIRKQEPEWGWQNNVCQYLEDGKWYIENTIIKAQNLVN